MKLLSVEKSQVGPYSHDLAPSDELQETRERCNYLQERLALVEAFLFMKLEIRIPGP